MVLLGKLRKRNIGSFFKWTETNLEAKHLSRQSESSTLNFHWNLASLLSYTLCCYTYDSKEAGDRRQDKCHIFRQKNCSVWICVLMTCLEETSYLLLMTLQGIPATVTEFWTSSARWPRLDPEMVTTVPPSTGPDNGSSWSEERFGSVFALFSVK